MGMLLPEAVFCPPGELMSPMLTEAPRKRPARKCGLPLMYFKSTATRKVAKAFKPDLLYVQAEIAEEGKGDLLPRVRSLLPRAKMIVTGAKLSDEDTSRYLKGGAAGVIAKSAQPALFVKSARKVMDNELWLPKSQVARLAQLLEGARERPRRPAETLTRQEKIVITYLMQGCRNREIARHLSITEQTVKNHLRTIYDKVGVSDRLELVLYAIHQRLELPALQPAEALP